MKRPTRPRLSYANVMSSIAVFAVLGGGVAWAHGKIGTSDLRNRAVTTKKVKKRAVKTPLIAGNAVKRGKIAAAAVSAAKLAGIVERSDTVPVIDGSQNNTTAECNPGETVISGGADWDSLNTGVRLQRSQRVGNGWNVAGANDSGAQRMLTAKAYCLSG